MIDVIEQQNKIIELQSEIIDELFSQLSQYVEISEEEKLLDAIETASKMQRLLG